MQTAIIVGILLLVLIILELIDIVPLESKIILIGFFPLMYDVQLVKDHRVTRVFFPIRIASTFDRNLCNLVLIFFRRQFRITCYCRNFSIY